MSAHDRSFNRLGGYDMRNWCCGARSRKTPEDPVVLAIRANDFKAFESAYQSAHTTDQPPWSTAHKIPNRPRALGAIRYLKIALKIGKCDPKIVVALLKDGALLSSQHSSTPITSRRALSDLLLSLPEQHQETLHYLLTYGASLTTVNKNIQATFPHQLIAQDACENPWIFAALNGILIKSIENTDFLTALFEAQNKTNTAHTDIAMMAIDALTQLNTPLDDTYQQHQFKKHHPTFSEKMQALATQYAQLSATSTQEKAAIINKALQPLHDEYLRLLSIGTESAATQDHLDSSMMDSLGPIAPTAQKVDHECTTCLMAQTRPSSTTVRP